jgi:hypothetical protein
MQCARDSDVIVKFAQSCSTALETRRTDDYFNQLLLKAEEVTEKLNLEQPALPRKKRVPKKIDYGVAEGDHHTTVQSLYRMNVCETLDTVVSQLAFRFSENDLSPLLNIERLLLAKLLDAEFHEKVTAVKKIYCSLSSSLSAQLEVLKVMMSNQKFQPETVDEVATFFSSNALHPVLSEVSSR